MAVTKDLILKALSTVEDPDLKKDLVTLGMIKDLVVEGNKVRFSVELTTPACPLKEIIKVSCQEAIEKEISEQVDLDINMTASVTSSREGPLLPEVKNIIAIASGKGGVGKSTITANLGVALAKSGAKVGIIDADIFGPSIPTMFNCEHEQPGVIKKGEQNLLIPILQYGVKVISMGFLTASDNAVVWRGPMASSALKQFISDTDWGGGLDYLLIDLPPGTSDIHLTMVQTVPVTGAVIVTTPQKVALADARKAIAMFRQPQINVPVLGLVENMAYFTPEELPENKYYIFGQEGGVRMAEELEIALLGQIPLVQSVRESGDNGYPAVLKDDVTAQSFQALANSMAQQIAIRNASSERTQSI